jgi:hypothetical protein
VVNHIGHSSFIVRITGKVFVALGFILGTYGLTEGQPDVMKAGLGLLIAGVISSAYGLYQQITHRNSTTDQQDGTKP